MKKKHPSPIPELFRNYLLTELMEMERPQRLEIAAAMLPYLDPPAEPGKWAIVLKNWINIGWVNDVWEVEQLNKFAG